MDDGPEPGRIEIELTSHEPTPDGRRRPTPTEDEAVDHESRLLATERGRLITVGVVVALVALLVGVMLGRLGPDQAADDGRRATTATSPSTETSPTTSPDRPSVLDTLPPAPDLTDSPTSTDPSPTTSAPDPEQLVPGTLALDPAVEPAPAEVVALTDARKIVRIDVATGDTLTTEVSGTDLGGPPTVYAGDGWILVPSYDGSEGSTVVFDDGSRTNVDVGESWPLFANEAAGTFWRLDNPSSNGVPERLVEITPDGVETGSVIELDGFYPYLIDPLGGVVVQAPGGDYVLTPESTVRITDGRLLALGPQRALVQQCGSDLTCGYFVLDRTTGGLVELRVDPALGDHPAIESAGWWAIRRSMSPEDDAVLIASFDVSGAGQSQGILDLTSGDYTEVTGSFDTPQMAWGVDGNTVYWLDQGTLKVFDRATGESVVFAADLGWLDAFAVRPVAVDDEGVPPAAG